MSPDFHEIWVYLSASPLAGLTLTLVAYQAGLWVFERFGRRPILNPVLIAVLLIAGLLTATGVEYRTYFDGAQFVHFLLGPATVALAVPLYKQFNEVRRSAPALLVALLAGSAASALSAVGIAWALGASQRTLLSLAPKSVTSPIAMGVSEQIGGLPSLTAVFVILTGIIAASLGTWVLNLVRVKDWRARGFGMGVAAHGIGTARALQVNEVAGAFAGLGMGLNALATAILLPVLYHLIFG
ncbi:LrgB family protein [Azospirillum rugosum]|uniref:Murein hydrolase (TIGR00659 family) n=1 Tax=Azospirillum rugosum TaxID=416170 RepID=A0ABS4SRP4_9PROT|nr:LrgB family protein [Azospirillum rugosum]MBP2294889.1 putative murein hydrolase (TIGR00659 family) [Azospirillum rugosum]MDQ0528189.1 putative murein hydrolase (TIGR00659 family) [Azospirillum rugosum]